jgi:hypothetical protein
MSHKPMCLRGLLEACGLKPRSLVCFSSRTGYEMDDREIGIRVRSRNFSSLTLSRPALGPIEPPVQWVPGVKRPEREADHLFTTAEFKKMWINTFTSPYA